jgi:3',5'-cyclic AMP phosphodiesterase CpdA
MGCVEKIGTAPPLARRQAMRTIAQISDLHFGAHEPAVVAHLHAALSAIRPDLIVVSGDLTQRAHRSQFAEAAGFLERLEAEGFWLIVVPGNHDVPMHKPVSRLLWPLRRYSRYIARGRSCWYADREIAVLGLASAHGLTVKDGRLTRIQIRSIAACFAAAPAGAARILVTHHPLVALPGDEPGEIEPALRGARRALAAVKAAGVHLVLAGHHHTHSVGIGAPGGPVLSIDPQVMVVQAGTATSWRRRGTPNSFNLIRLDGPDVTIEEWTAEGGAFSCRAPGRSAHLRTAADNGGRAEHAHA